MVWWLFKKKKDDKIEQRFVNLHTSLHESFSNIKNDMSHINRWLGSFIDKHDDQEKKFELLNYRINNIEEVLEELRDVRTRVQTAVQTGGLSKQPQTDSRPNSRPNVSKQQKTSEELTVIERLRNLTMIERAVVWALLNTNLKLSYDDLRVALGKDKSTLRGQINNIKSKSEGLVEEYTERDGKKRFHISEKIKNEIFKGIGRKEKVTQKVKKAIKKSESEI